MKSFSLLILLPLLPLMVSNGGKSRLSVLSIDGFSNHDIGYEVPSNFPAPCGISLQPVKLVYGEQDGWKSLYNGRDLEGWYVKCRPGDRTTDFWKAHDGYIECNSLGSPGHDYVWLMNDGEYGDFQLRLEFQVFKSSPGNSGVQFRSRFDESDETSPGGWLNGPQCDIHPPMPYRTGLIYDETRGVQRWIYPSLPDWEIVPEQAPREAQSTSLVYADQDPDAWNSLELIAQDMQIRTFINGHRVTKFDASGILDDAVHQHLGVGRFGQIALQLHTGDELHIRFRNIYIREIPPNISNK